jgi:tRNA (Thr-GGU) A37 N-methylase
MKMKIAPIGIIRTPLKSSMDSFIQSIWSDVIDEARVLPEYIEGLASLIVFLMSFFFIGFIWQSYQ